MKKEQTYVVKYKGKGIGFAETEMFMKATSKTEAKEKVWDKVAKDNPCFTGITFKGVSIL